MGAYVGDVSAAPLAARTTVRILGAVTSSNVDDGGPNVRAHLLRYFPHWERPAALTVFPFSLPDSNSCEGNGLRGGIGVRDQSNW